MTEAQHRELLDVLAGIAGKFMLSGYPSDLYRQWEVRHGWNRHEFLIDNKASAGKVKETTGKLVGNPRLRAEGKADQAEGKVQKKIGEIGKGDGTQ